MCLAKLVAAFILVKGEISMLEDRAAQGVRIGQS
jgi:hypothetical protein